MRTDPVEIWARGGLGNQIIEYLYGIAESIEDNKPYKLLFSGKEPDKKDNIAHTEEKPTVNQLFEFTQSITIDNAKRKKVCYWDPYLTDLYFKHCQKIWGKHIKSKENEETLENYVVIHVRGTDKMNDRKLADKLYDELFNLAKSNCLPIKIATDDKDVAQYLCHRHGIDWQDTCNNAIQDWRMLKQADHIYSIYSTFSYSVLLVKPNLKYTVASYQNSYESYKYVDNEYLILCQLQKYCKNLKLLPSKNVKSSKESGLSHCKMLNNREQREIAAMTKKTENIKKTINDICNYISKPSLPSWHRNNEIQRESYQSLIKYFYSGDKNLYYKTLSVHLFERGLYQSRQLLSHAVHKKTVELTRDHINKFKMTNDIMNQQARILDKDGVIIIPNFLSKDIFKKIGQECLIFDSGNSGSLSKNYESVLSGQQLKNSISSQIFLSKEFTAFMAYMTGYPLNTTKDMIYNNTFFQKVNVSLQYNDVQTTLHSDTFFPAFKFWYFPIEVGKNDSPFSYCKSTHLLTANRLAFDHQNLLDSVLGRGKGISKDHREGSFRATDNEITQLSSKRVKMCNPENTLIIANVFGYHARSFPVKSISRIAIHGSLRYKNPFKSQ